MMTGQNNYTASNERRRIILSFNSKRQPSDVRHGDRCGVSGESWLMSAWVAGKYSAFTNLVGRTLHNTVADLEWADHADQITVHETFLHVHPFRTTVVVANHERPLRR